MPARFKDLCLDARDHQALADWWCDAMGYVRDVESGEQRPPEKSVPIVDPTGRGPLIWVIPVPEHKVVKNRVHLDVLAPDLETSTNEALALGARKQGDVVLEDDGAFQVLLDPEDNELCLVTGP